MHEAEYIREAAEKFRDSGAMFPAQIQEQYREIQSRPVGEIKPYVHPVESGDLEPILPRRTIRQMIVVSWSALAISLSAGLFTVVASGALNVAIGWCIGGAAILLVISGVANSVRGTSPGANYGGHSGTAGQQNINITINAPNGGNVNFERK
jgi:hypothetical protein